MARKSEFGSNWWAERWISALEHITDSARLGRGRSYARSGHVLDIHVEKGKVRAKVQGSRPRPYDVAIELAPIGHSDWEKVLRVMAEQAIFSAQLLAGQMPQNIEDAFRAAGVSLFPTSSLDLATHCSCPDWANPCKHIAAVYYLLGSEFDRDPFLLFWLRGRTKEEVVAALRDLRSADLPVDEAAALDSPDASTPEPAVPLDSDPSRFWAMGEGFASLDISLSPPRVPEAILKRLGSPSFGSDPAAARDSLAEMYRTVGNKALELAAGDEKPSPGRQ